MDHSGLARSLFGWPPEKKTLRETAWLDGLRGAAAFLVLVHHWSAQWTSNFWSAPFGAEVLENVSPDYGYYYRAKGERFWGFWRLPFFRMLSSGGAHVCLLFVLSGFVLSWAPLLSIQTEDFERLHHSLGSSVVRRWFRLYLAGAVVTLTFFIHKVLFDNHDKLTFMELVWDYATITEKWANPFDMHHITPFSTIHMYNGVLWTIPFEFSGSIFVFVLLLAIGRTRNFQRRVAIILVISFYAAFKLRWDYWLFGIGCALADYVRHNGGFHKLSQFSDPQLWTVVLVFGVLLMGWVGPLAWYSNPGYTWSASVPMPEGAREKLGEGVLIWGAGSALVVTSACHLGHVREVFETRLLQYLGRISFMLYLVHMLVSTAIGMPIRAMLYETFCVKQFNDTYNDYVYFGQPRFHITVYFLLWAVCLPILLALSHFLEENVDRPCLAFGRWIDAWLTEEPVRSPLLKVDETQRSSRSSSGSYRDDLPELIKVT